MQEALAAAFAQVLSCNELEAGGEIDGCATDRQQASIVVDVAGSMVEQFPELKRMFKMNPSQKRMTFTPLSSF